jgi:hypothetical protein
MHIGNGLFGLSTAVLLLLRPACARDAQSSHRHYRSSDGSMIHGSTREANAA